MKLIIFDLQGTLLENGVFPSPIKQVKYILNVRNTFHEFVPEFEKVFMTQKFDNLSQGFLAVAQHFDENIPDFVVEKLVGVWNKNKLLSKLFDDAIPVLSQLKSSHKLALIANIDCFTKDVIEKYKLSEYFDKMYLSCETGKLKTDPVFFENIIKDFDVEKKDILVVGDSIESDMMSAMKSGISSVLIDRNDRMDYDNKIQNLKDLLKYIED